MAMNIFVICLVSSLSAVQARRIKYHSDGSHETKDGTADTENLFMDTADQVCHIKEREQSLKYGIEGSFSVKGCLECKFNRFLVDTLPYQIVGEPQLVDDGKTCKCFYSPRFWEADGLAQKQWFQYKVFGNQECSEQECLNVFFSWSHNFLKKQYHPGDNEVMPREHMINVQEAYDFSCEEGEAKGIVLPSPADKIQQLVLLIEKETNPDEKLRLQKVLDELLRGKDIEVFSYDLEADWGRERETDVSSDGEHHTFFLKPCVSNHDREIDELVEIMELCGQPEIGVSKKGGRLRTSYALDDTWGPELACVEKTEACAAIEVAFQEGGALPAAKLLSFRLKPCRSPGGTEIDPNDLDSIYKGCGPASPEKNNEGFAALLPVKLSVVEMYDAEAELEDEIPWTGPCA